MGTRRKSRELALQMLFQADMGKQDADQVRKTFWAEHGTASAEVRGFADDLFRVATDRVGDIDQGRKPTFEQPTGRVATILVGTGLRSR